MITFGMVFSTMWLEFKHMAQDPLVRRELVSASCNRRLDEGLETQMYSLYHKEHPANCPLRWRLSNGLGCISHDCKLDLVPIQGDLTGDQYIRDVLQPVVVSHFDNHPLATRPVYMDDNARPHRSRAVTAYLQSEAVTSVPWPAMSSDMNPIEHIWDMLGRRMLAKEPPVQNNRQLEAALYREWQQLSQQDIRRLTGGMRRKVEAVIQSRGGYTRYGTLNNRCRQVIHK
jgi:transposase